MGILFAARAINGGIYRASKEMTAGNVKALNKVDKTTVVVTSPGRISNSVAMIVVRTAVGMLASIIDVDLAKPVRFRRPAIRTAMTGATSNLTRDAGNAS